MTGREGSTDERARDAEPHGTQVPPRWGHNGRPSTAVVEAVADALGREPVDVSPLQHHVDADALDALVAHQTSEDANGVRVTFEYEKLEVTVDSDGGIEIGPIAAD